MSHHIQEQRMPFTYPTILLRLFRKFESVPYVDFLVNLIVNYFEFLVAVLYGIFSSRSLLKGYYFYGWI